MRPSRLASVAAILAGAAWVASAVLGWGGRPEVVSSTTGVVLLVVSLAAAGYSLVATAPLWLRAVVTVATPALGLAVWWTVRDAPLADDLTVLAGGVLLLVGGGAGLVRASTTAKGGSEPRQGVRGRRAAR